MQQIVILEEEQELCIPENCWCIDMETRELITSKTVTIRQAKKVMLLSKCAGG